MPTSSPEKRVRLQKEFTGPAKLSTCIRSLNASNNLLRWGLLLLQINKKIEATHLVSGGTSI